ncbi:MAG: hypothetical protein IKK68_06455 [Paludibacteraceae bacterium]|nr:hypothetical protein [Paludibacteraceae bacterium]
MRAILLTMFTYLVVYSELLDEIKAGTAVERRCGKTFFLSFKDAANIHISAPNGIANFGKWIYSFRYETTISKSGNKWLIATSQKVDDIYLYVQKLAKKVDPTSWAK